MPRPKLNLSEVSLGNSIYCLYTVRLYCPDINCNEQDILSQQKVTAVASSKLMLKCLNIFAA